MKRFRWIVTLAVLAALPATASIPDIPDPDAGGIDPRQLVTFRKCEVARLGEGRTLFVFDELSEAIHKIELGKKVKLRAVSKAQFDGRKKLTFEDLEVGQVVKVSFRKADGQILRLDVLPETSTRFAAAGLRVVDPEN